MLKNYFLAGAGTKTASITCVTPFLDTTSAIVTVAPPTVTTPSLLVTFNLPP